jgi:hypothetical protein
MVDYAAKRNKWINYRLRLTGRVDCAEVKTAGLEWMVECLIGEWLIAVFLILSWYTQ